MAEGGAPEEIVQRISLAGGEDVIAQLAEIGKVGESAFLRIVAALGPAGELLTGMATAITGIGAALGAWAHHSSEATEAVGNLAKQTGSTIEEISGLTGALSESGVSAGELGAAFRRLAITSENQWAEIRKSVRDSRDQMVNDHLAVQGSLQSVASAEVALRNAREESARLQGRAVPGDDPEVAMYRKRADARRAVQEAELKLAEAQQKSVEAAKKADEDRKNSMESVGAAVESIASGQKSFEDASKGANLEVGNVIKGILVAAKAGEEGGLGLKQFGGGLAELSTQGPKALDVFFKLADVMKNSGSASLNTALQVRLLGRSLGENFNAVLSKGSEATKEEIERLKQLGLVLTDTDDIVGKKFKVSFSTLSDELSTTFTQMGNLFGPAFTEGFNAFRKVIEDNHEAIIKFASDIATQAKPLILDFFRVLSGQKAETPWINTIVTGVKFISTTLAGVVKDIKGFADSVATELNKAFGTSFSGIGLLITAWALRAVGAFQLVGAAVVALTGTVGGLLAVLEKLRPLLAILAAYEIAKDVTHGPENKAQAELDALQKQATEKNMPREEYEKKVNEIMAKYAAGGDDAAKATDKAGEAAHQAGSKYEEMGKKGAAAFDAISKGAKTVSPEVEARRQSISAAGGINLADLVYHPPSGPPPPRPATEHAQFRTVGDTSSGIQFKTVADTLRQLGVGATPKPAEQAVSPQGIPPGMGTETPLARRYGADLIGEGLKKTMKEIQEASLPKLLDTYRVLRGLEPGQVDKSRSPDTGAVLAPGVTKGPLPEKSQQQLVASEILSRLKEAVEQAPKKEVFAPTPGVATAAANVPSPPPANINEQAMGSIAKGAAISAAGPFGPVLQGADLLLSAFQKLADFINSMTGKAPAGGTVPLPPERPGAPAADLGAAEKPIAPAAEELGTTLQKSASSSDAFANALSAAEDKIGEFISALAAAAAAAFTSPKGAGQATSGGGLASGGLVRGAGSGTSDSILARVSHGEYVVRADGGNLMDAVSHFAGSFSVGGLIERMNLPRFAGGGAVARAAAGAGGHGRPLVLDFSGAGGGKYSAMMDHSTAESLTKFAIRKNMVSGGKKPSWFG